MTIIAKYGLLVFALTISTLVACVNDEGARAATENEAIETPKQPLSDTDAEGVTSPPSADIVAENTVDIGMNEQDEESAGGTVSEPAPDADQRLEQYFQRQGDEDKIDPVTEEERREMNEGVSYLYGYEEEDAEAAPTAKAGDYEITYYRNDAEFYNDKTTASSSAAYNYKEGKSTPQPMKVVDGKKVPIKKLGDKEDVSNLEERGQGNEPESRAGGNQ